EILQEKADPGSQRSLGSFPVAKAFVQESIATYGSDYFFVVSEPLKSLFIRRGVRSDSIAIIRNGVDLELFRPMPQQEARLQLGVTWPRLVASVGNLVTGKGHERSMCFGTTEYPWNEHEAVKQALRARLDLIA
ncbi:MAG: hypothetical protein HGA94_01300, partial [Candidatus Aminicenantes bacterium]|nr:hypothetical protein [Candidatus Aminicenantes bacterium]